MREGIKPYHILVSEPKGNRPLGKPRRKGKYNIKLILNRIGEVAFISVAKDWNK